MEAMQEVFNFMNQAALLASSEGASAGWWSSLMSWVDGILSNETWFFLITTLIKIVICFLIVVPLIVVSVYIERRGAGIIQDRVGPNRLKIPFSLIPIVNKFIKKDKWTLLGLIQPAVDGGKLFLKQDFTPPFVRKFYFIIAPTLVMIPSLVIMAIIPLASDITTPWGHVNMVVSNISAGPILVFAISAFSVYGITLAGWSSNSKYPFLGGIRSSAQMISYEICLGLSIIPLLMIYKELNLSHIVQYQAANGWTIFPFWGEGLPSLWLLIPVLISFIIFTTSMFVETNRTPFDMPECETELVGGYHTEYSSMKFALFFMGEYAAMVVGSAIIVTLFFGGWSIGFGLDGWLKDWAGVNWGWLVSVGQIIVFFIKLVAFISFFVWVRWTVPRFRYDQVMKLGWLLFFELAIVNIFLTAGILYLSK